MSSKVEAAIVSACYRFTMFNHLWGSLCIQRSLVLPNPVLAVDDESTNGSSTSSMVDELDHQLEPSPRSSASSLSAAESRPQARLTRSARSFPIFIVAKHGSSKGCQRYNNRRTCSVAAEYHLVLFVITQCHSHRLRPLSRSLLHAISLIRPRGIWHRSDVHYIPLTPRIAIRSFPIPPTWMGPRSGTWSWIWTIWREQPVGPRSQTTAGRG
jgi:hypothetical protein